MIHFATLPDWNFSENDQIIKLNIIILKTINNLGIKVPEILINVTA